MSDNWGQYFANMAGHPASILFDDGVSAQIDGLSLNLALKVRVPLSEWNEDGLTTDAEARKLSALENKIEAKVVAAGGLLLGRVTTNRQRWILGLLPEPGKTKGVRRLFGAKTEPDLP